MRYLFIGFLRGKFAERIGLRRNAQLGIIHMRIDLCGVQIFMAQKLLQGTHVHTVREHQRCRRVAQLVCGILVGVQTGTQERFLHHSVQRFAGNARAAAGKEQSVPINGGNIPADDQIIVDRLRRGVVEIDDALFVALAEHADMIAPNV